MRHLKLAIAFSWALVLLAGAPLYAQRASPSDSKKSEEQAMGVLKQMAEFVAKAKSFSVTIEAGFDAVQESGQKIEFGETRKVVLRRPDRLRVDSTKRDGSQGGLVFDGKEITVFHAKENVYASAAKAGSVDQAVAFLVNDLDVRLPLAELLNSNLDKALPQRVRSAAYVEQSFIGGVPCDHVAFRGDDVDGQLWVTRDKQPVPRRIVITYKLADGRPQFWAQFSDWNFAPQAADSLFAYKPAKDAAKIAFSPRQTLQPGNVSAKGAQ